MITLDLRFEGRRTALLRFLWLASMNDPLPNFRAHAFLMLDELYKDDPVVQSILGKLGSDLSGDGAMKTVPTR